MFTIFQRHTIVYRLPCSPGISRCCFHIPPMSGTRLPTLSVERSSSKKTALLSSSSSHSSASAKCLARGTQPIQMAWFTEVHHDMFPWPELKDLWDLSLATSGHMSGLLKAVQLIQLLKNVQIFGGNQQDLDLQRACPSALMAG